MSGASRGGGTVYHYFQAWQNAHKRVKGRKRHILVDTLGLLVANRVEPADTSDRRAGALLLGGLSALFPRIRTIIADAGHEGRKLARTLKQHQGWQLRIVKRRQRAFKITGLTWIVERSFAWLGRNRRLSKDYEYRVQTSETMIDPADGTTTALTEPDSFDTFVSSPNMLMIQRVLSVPDHAQRMMPDDLRALTPLIYAHATPYGTFRLDMSKRLALIKIPSLADHDAQGYLALGDRNVFAGLR